MVGKIELITWPMYSGKSTELIREVQRLRFAGANIGCFKPDLDFHRYQTTAICSHDHQQSQSLLFRSVNELEKRVRKHPFINGIAIDEIHFVEGKVVGLIRDLKKRGLQIILAGLFYDFREEPFVLKGSKYTMEDIACIADEKKELTAVGTYKEGGLVCGNSATRTQRLDIEGRPVPYNDALVVVGGERLENSISKDRIYEARCSQHHLVVVDNKVLTFDQFRKSNARRKN